MRYFLLLIVPCLFLISCIEPSKTNSTKLPAEELSNDLQKIFEDESLAGLTVAVVCNNKVTYSDGFGLADIERQVPMTPESIVRVASISKSVTATALMMLYEQGKCQLDEDISKYLGFTVRNPHFKDVPITLRMLLSHTASIQDADAYYSFSRQMRAQKLNIAELFQPASAYYHEELFLNHYPGTFFNYSNVTWGLIASIIEKISGQRFDIFCSENIFKPLEMNAAFNVNQLPDINQLAVLYRFEDTTWAAQADNYQGKMPDSLDMSWYKLGHNGLWFGPQGSLRSSANDLAKFMLMHINEGEYEGNRILQSKTVRMMHAEEWLYTEENGNTFGDFMFSWGLGFHRLTRRDSTDILFPDRDMVGHPGEAYGLISDMYFNTESKSGVIFMTNGSQYPYKYGLHSTFYRPEEKVFEAIYGYGLLCEEE